MARVLRDVLHVYARSKAPRYLLPGLSTVTRAIDVRYVVRQAMTVDRGVGLIHIKVCRDEHYDLAPWRQPGRRDICPRFAVVIGFMYQTIIGSDPNGRRPQWRRCDRIDHAAAFVLWRVRCRCLVEVCGHTGVLTRHILRDLCPTFAAVSGLVEKLIAEIKRVRIGL